MRLFSSWDLCYLTVWNAMLCCTWKLCKCFLNIFCKGSRNIVSKAACFDSDVLFISVSAIRSILYCKVWYWFWYLLNMVSAEYAYITRVTAAGNVYSFGVILLELLTGRPPITNGIDLAKWVQSTLSGEETWKQILDTRIRDFSLETQNQMISMLKVALSCISSSPDTRPKMRTVVERLQMVRQVAWMTLTWFLSIWMRFTARQFMSGNRILCSIILRRLKSISIITNMIRINIYSDMELWGGSNVDFFT